MTKPDFQRFRKRSKAGKNSLIKYFLYALALLVLVYFILQYLEQWQNLDFDFNELP
jgi:hypothetical protein